ncbi:MAG: hypothetical protein LBU32_25625 [Clostridiales bacterium]|nr:hypothetical protein [Clostridiales bacterium]
MSGDTQVMSKLPDSYMSALISGHVRRLHKNSRGRNARAWVREHRLWRWSKMKAISERQSANGSATRRLTSFRASESNTKAFVVISKVSMDSRKNSQ